MAKQCGSHPFTGKMGGTIGYRVNGEYLERENGAKEGKAFRKDPRRRRTMYYAALFKQASKAMVAIYRALPADQRKHGVYGKLTGQAFSLLRMGKTIEEMKAEIMQLYVTDKLPLADTKQIEAGQVFAQKRLKPGVKDQPAAANTLPHLLRQPASIVATIVSPYFYSTMSY
jgi:hypothetical protein